MDSVFSKIIARSLPANIRYEDDEFIAFDDIKPAAPVHVLVVPKKIYMTLENVDIADVHFHARFLQVARTVADTMGVADNYRITINVGRQMQLVQHLHLHVVGGWKNLAQASQEQP